MFGAHVPRATGLAALAASAFLRPARGTLGLFGAIGPSDGFAGPRLSLPAFADWVCFARFGPAVAAWATLAIRPWEIGFVPQNWHWWGLCPPPGRGLPKPPRPSHRQRRPGRPALAQGIETYQDCASGIRHTNSHSRLRGRHSTKTEQSPSRQDWQTRSRWCILT